ncbi:MAG: sulfite reductase subunit alpha [Chthoniobacteraceae bacterium]
MQPIPFIPENSPFSREQRQWLNGYLAGMFSHSASESTGTPAARVGKPLLVIYGSQTGTAEGLAKKLHREAQQRGLVSRMLAMDAIQPADLITAENLAVITSTYGDGEPPDNAQTFWHNLRDTEAPALTSLKYAVLALGDTNYPAFCEFGKQCDARLQELGAQPLQPRVDCDVDYEVPALSWRESLLQALAGESAAEAVSSLLPEKAETGYSRINPFPARMLVNRLLSGAGSAKEVRHFEIALEGSSLSYEAGDALGVLPSNCPSYVSELLVLLGCDGEEAVPLADGGETSLRHALIHHYELGRPHRDLLEAAASRSGGEALRALLDPARAEELKQWLQGREVIDVLLSVTDRFEPAEFIRLLRKLQPRLYSISSSPNAHPGEVHATVGIVRYSTHDRDRKGVCSTFLADRCSESGQLPVFIQKSHGFRLPEDSSRPIIMVGPGTGIAPFRAFLEERRVSGATGLNWLFFGDQRAATDFLYREELESMRADGHLSRLDLAFSREQPEKVYVQHRMQEAAAQLWEWLEDGAHFYVCGDASRMAKDVDAALHEVLQRAGGLSEEAATAYMGKLKEEKRYQRDVY